MNKGVDVDETGDCFSDENESMHAARRCKREDNGHYPHVFDGLFDLSIDCLQIWTFSISRAGCRCASLPLHRRTAYRTGSDLLLKDICCHSDA